MESTTVNIDLKNLDKSSWHTYRFDEIASKISERVDPTDTELEVYVGLEHLDGEDIHIRRHGVPSDVKGQKLRCYPGDIIFGKRRAYQRKAAIVDFDGICSAHAFVFRANPAVIDPDLFPFFLHSDQFMHRAVDISVGGLSPTINWGDIRHQEFLLPPKDQQAQLAELLLAMDEVVAKKRNTFDSMTTFLQSKSRNLLRGLNKESIRVNRLGSISKDWELIRISDIFKRIVQKNRDLSSNNVLTISAQDGLVNQEEYFNRIVASKSLTNYYLLNRGDFAYNKSYSIGYPAGAIKMLEKYETGVVSPLYICFRCEKSQVFREYYKRLFNSGFLNAQILSVAKEGARNHGLLNVSTSDFLNLILPLPPERDISKILDEIIPLEKIKEESLLSYKTSQRLLKTLINSLL